MASRNFLRRSANTAAVYRTRAAGVCFTFGFDFREPNSGSAKKRCSKALAATLGFVSFKLLIFIHKSTGASQCP
jgi:hypothetical protein